MRAGRLRRTLQTMEFAMKKLILIIALGLGLGSVSAFAQDYRYEDRSAYAHPRGGRVGYEVNHVNRMLAHVQWQLRRYGGGWFLRREVAHISGEVNHINWEYRTGNFRWYRLQREIEHVHSELHSVEQRLRVRSGDYYRWR